MPPSWPMAHGDGGDQLPEHPGQEIVGVVEVERGLADAAHRLRPTDLAVETPVQAGAVERHAVGGHQPGQHLVGVGAGLGVGPLDLDEADGLAQHHHGHGGRRTTAGCRGAEASAVGHRVAER